MAVHVRIGHFITEIICRAMAQALTDRVIAGSGGALALLQNYPTGKGANRVEIVSLD
ncbi:MAG: hypothetical protein V1796_00295 [Pseudomonadota bacterium]